MTQKLQARGISPETIEHFQIKRQMAFLKAGWSYPVTDRHGNVLARRWKNLDSSDKPKYIWERGSHAGKLIYNAPALTRVPDNGELWIVNGEPVVWQMHTGGKEAICWFGEGNIPLALGEALSQVNVKIVHYAPDNDATGRNPETLAKLKSILDSEGVDLRLYDFVKVWKPEYGQCTDGSDLGNLIKAACIQDGKITCELLTEILAAVQNCPLEIVFPADIPPEPQQKRLPDVKKPLPSSEKTLPDAFIQAIEQALGVKRFNREGWSKNLKCPFKKHEHDHRQPGAQWNRDMQCLRCHKCGQTWNAKETGETLDIKLDSFLEKKAEKPATPPKAKDSKAPKEAGKDTAKSDDIPAHTGLGDDLIAQWEGDIRFFREKWHSFNGEIWQPLAVEQIRKIVWLHVKEARLKYFKFKPKKSDVNSIADYLQSMLFVPDDMIDQGQNVIPLQGGLYNLVTGEIEAYRRNLFLTSQLGFAFDPDASCPQWLQFLDEMVVTTAKEPDKELQQLLQEAFGYSLTDDVRKEVSFWLYGEGGSGKSTVLEVLQALAGEAWTELDLSSLDRNGYQLADLPGKRIVTCSEVATGSYLQDHVFKKLVSGETMMVRQIRERPFTFRPQCKLWWAMNNAPGIRDRSEGVYRRLITMPFNNPLPEEKRDTTLKDRLLTELPGIFNWSLEGLARLQHNGKFTVPGAALELKAEIRQENDPEATFMQEWCEVASDGRVKSSHLYTAYRTWCQKNGLSPKSNTKIARDWSRLGLIKKREPDSNYWLGIYLSEEASTEIGEEYHESPEIPF